MQYKLNNLKAHSKQLLMENFNELGLCASNIIEFGNEGSMSVLWYKKPIVAIKKPIKRKGKKNE